MSYTTRLIDKGEKMYNGIKSIPGKPTSPLFLAIISLA